jgi:hypothetical protein
MKKANLNYSPEASLSAAAVRGLQARYQRLKQEVLDLGWIAQGTLLFQPPGAWRLTGKRRAKTFTLALSAQQAALYEQAIATHRKLEVILREMREISEKVLQNSVPGVRRRPRRRNPKTALS